jgi:hypothetical protein
MEIAMLKQTGSALALALLFVLSPATAMAYGGYFPPTEEAKPAPPHHMMKHHHPKKMKHHRAGGETPRMEEKTY